MTDKLLPISITIALAAFGAVCDGLLKRATAHAHPILTWEFWAGSIGYGISAFAWVWVLSRLKLATIGAIYSVTIVILLVVMGATIFRESLSASEIVGLCFAVAALILLGRFA